MLTYTYVSGIIFQSAKYYLLGVTIWMETHDAQGKRKEQEGMISASINQQINQFISTE